VDSSTYSVDSSKSLVYPFSVVVGACADLTTNHNCINFEIAFNHFSDHVGKDFLHLGVKGFLDHVVKGLE